MINKYHQELVKIIEKVSSKGPGNSESAAYLGSLHFHYGLSAPQRQKITDSWVYKHKDLTAQEFINLLNSLYQGNSYEEKTLAGSLLRHYPELKAELDPKLLGKWLEKLEGWAEVDSLCQSTFSAEEIFSDWQAWEALIKNFVQSDNINKNRASLVLLTRPVRESSDKRLGSLAFLAIDKLKHKKEVLITKAVSWLLRDLIQNFRDKVEVYLKDNSSHLAKIAVRETLVKLKTGKKT